MSEKFLDYMREEEYNDYHRELFGDKWKDVEHRKTSFTILERIKLLFSHKELKWELKKQT